MPAHILCIEDEPDLLDDLMLELSDAGYAVKGVADGEQGLAVLRSQTVDLVICDVQLPAMSGIELIECARAELTIATPPFILLTAYGDALLRKQADALGVSCLFIKPVDYDALDECLRSLFSSKKEPQGSAAASRRSGRTPGTGDDLS